ncbi:MAG: hypothetical protein AB7O38_29730, partial [Pirellulaceae bacterium]
AIVLITPLNEPLLRKPYAGNPHVRFDEEEGSAHNRPSLLYRFHCLLMAAEERGVVLPCQTFLVCEIGALGVSNPHQF